MIKRVTALAALALVAVPVLPAHADTPSVATFSTQLTDGSTVTEQLPMSKPINSQVSATESAQSPAVQADSGSSPSSSGSDQDVQAATTSTWSQLVATNTCDYWGWDTYGNFTGSGATTSDPHPNYPATKNVQLWDESYVSQGELNTGTTASASTDSGAVINVPIGDSRFLRADITYPWRVKGHLRASSAYSPLTILNPFVDSKSTSSAAYNLAVEVAENSIGATRTVANATALGTNGTGGSLISVSRTGTATMSIALHTGQNYSAGLHMLTDASLDGAPGASVEADSYFRAGGDEIGYSQQDYSRWVYTVTTGYSVSACGGRV